MICRECGSKMKVMDSFCQDNVIYRRHKCPDCGHKMFTMEEEASSNKVKFMLNQKNLLNKEKRNGCRKTV